MNIDWVALGVSIESEVTSGLAVFLPIAAVLLGISVAWSLGKRFIGADSSPDFDLDGDDFDFDDDLDYSDVGIETFHTAEQLEELYEYSPSDLAEMGYSESEIEEIYSL